MKHKTIKEFLKIQELRFQNKSPSFKSKKMSIPINYIYGCFNK